MVHQKKTATLRQQDNHVQTPCSQVKPESLLKKTKANSSLHLLQESLNLHHKITSIFLHLCLSPFQVISGQTTCTAMVERRAWLIVNPTALEFLTANIQRMSESCATRSAFQASSSSGTRPAKGYVPRMQHTHI